MFYGKKIKELERWVAMFKRELDEARDEVKRLKSVVEILTEESAVTLFDTDVMLALLDDEEGTNQDRIATIKRTKEAYEKKLARFVRSTTSRRRVANKKNNGEENSGSK